MSREQSLCKRYGRRKLVEVGLKIKAHNRTVWFTDELRDASVEMLLQVYGVSLVLAAIEYYNLVSRGKCVECGKRTRVIDRRSGMCRECYASYYGDEMAGL